MKIIVDNAQEAIEVADALKKAADNTNDFAGVESCEFSDYLISMRQCIEVKSEGE